MTTTHDTPSQASSLSILVAEDSPTHQKLAAALLTRRGYSVTVASNGKEAVEALEGKDFDLVLMDVDMPVMDGLQATGLIRDRESRTGRHVPVVAVTATADRGDCLAAGMDAYITKPLRPDVLDATMNEVLGI
jgi:CheY-like chemotaxis protein